MSTHGLALYKSIGKEELSRKRERLYQVLEDCSLCPRVCHVNRLKGELGFCRTGKSAIVSSFGPHFGEEFPLVGTHGSGTVFFTNCNLGCIFCQNYDISHLGRGSVVDTAELASIFLKIQSFGCHNLNLVTPTHVIPQIIEALEIAVEKGFSLPLVYNCGGYESVESIKVIDGIIDIYMPDFKFMDDEIAFSLTGARSYSKHAKESVKEMHRQVGDLKLSREGIALKGLLVRHLILPGFLSGTEKVLQFLSEEISSNTYLNLMDQYYPCYLAKNHETLSRRIYPEEWSRAYELAKNMGFSRLDGEV
jgi:putative pyruvate formate lyase activating enzyme